MNQNSSKIDFEKVEQLALYNLQNRRSYASFFEWKNPNDSELGKKVKERAVTCDLIKSLEKDAGRKLFQTVRYGENPPDTIAADMDGNLTGFEVTELVDEETVKLWSKKLGKDKEWEMEEVIKEIEHILRKKSQKLAAVPYKKNILVMYTDERDLRWKFRAGEFNLSSHFFQKHRHIAQAYLLFSYQPGRETYPYLELNFLS
jgi:hypothetical protein